MAAKADISEVSEEKTEKRIGRPTGTGTASTRLLRVLITPRQDRLLTKLRLENGMSESEYVRRAIDDLIDKLMARGELIDPGPVTVPTITKED